MELTNWEFGTAFSRWLMYLGMAAAIGGGFSLHFLRRFRHLRRQLMAYTLGAAILGLFASISHFFVRVGSVTEEGAAGMFEPDMVGFLWESALGDSLLLRSIGFIAIVAALLLHALLRGRSNTEKVELNIAETFIAVGGFVLIALSFSAAGHAVEQPWLYQSLLTVHVLLTAWWIGLLYPLWLTCHSLTFNEAFLVLERFGQLAIGAVLTLFVGGLYMSYQLTGWTKLFSYSYGQLLMIKVILVLVILLLAAIHKFALVPQLKETKDAGKLKRSIFIEKIIGASIFAITTVLTTLVGPIH